MKKRFRARHTLMKFHYREKGQYKGRGFREGGITILYFKASGMRMKSDISIGILNLEAQCLPNSERKGLPMWSQHPFKLSVKVKRSHRTYLPCALSQELLEYVFWERERACVKEQGKRRVWGLRKQEVAHEKETVWISRVRMRKSSGWWPSSRGTRRPVSTCC